MSRHSVAGRRHHARERNRMRDGNPHRVPEDQLDPADTCKGDHEELKQWGDARFCPYCGTELVKERGGHA